MKRPSTQSLLLILGTTAACGPLHGPSSERSTGSYAHGAAHHGPHIDPRLDPPPALGHSDRRVWSTTERPAAGGGDGAFRTVCDPSHYNDDDPLVFPGRVGAAHHHLFFGNTGTNAHSTYESLASSGNSTCRGGIANRSAYWIPALIDTATSGVVSAENANIYYKSGFNGIAPGQIQPLPRGLRMIAGDAKSKQGQDDAYWGCRDEYVGHLDSIPIGLCAPGDAVMLTIRFPQCWDGVNLDSADHKIHVAPTVDGECPSSHPVALPELSYNVNFPVPADGDTSTWRLSSDLYDPEFPGGLSAHADYFEAWEAGVANAWATNCVKAGKDCHSHLLGDGRMID